MAPVGRLAVLLAGGALRTVAIPGRGNDNCPCINPHQNERTKEGMTGVTTEGGQVQYRSPLTDQVYTFPTTWGVNCAAHDKDLAPYCAGDKSPAWCKAEWCYVLHDHCEGFTNVKAKWLNGVHQLYFSYATCRGEGGSGAAAADPWDDDAVDATRLVIAQLDSYARGATQILENFAKQGGSTDCTLGANEDMCPCTSCSTSAHWDSSIDFFEVGIKKGPTGADDRKDHAICMAEEVANTYQAVAAKEMDADFQKVGYMYFGEADTGGYAQYPKEDMTGQCENVGENDFDPRYRPWYAGGATGPKDVILLIDTSGSMYGADRWLKAKKAALLVLDTLTWKDFVSIILFDSRVTSDQVYGDGHLVPATETNKLQIKAWINQGSDWASGGTNFRNAFEKVWEVLECSVAEKQYSFCQKVIMFMTDGEDPSFDDGDFHNVQQKAIKYDAFVLTYALGSGATPDTPKRLACDNRGIFYPVADNQDLASVMGRYFDYFAQGQEICNTQFVKYGHAHTSSTLYGACMPMYDRSTEVRDLLGVSCIDVNLLKDLNEMKKQAGWNHFLCQATDITKTCRSLDLSDCHLQRARAAYSSDSVCPGDDYADTSARCPCQSPSCQDDPEYTDMNMYFCDTWIGDDCNDDAKWADWGYTPAGMAEIRSKCPRSCGLCQWQNPCPQSTAGECEAPPVMDECRACVGVTSGVDIEGRPMAYGQGCPADSPRNLMTTTTNPSALSGCSSHTPAVALIALTSTIAAGAMFV